MANNEEPKEGVPVEGVGMEKTLSRFGAIVGRAVTREEYFGLCAEFNSLPGVLIFGRDMPSVKGAWRTPGTPERAIWEAQWDARDAWVKARLLVKDYEAAHPTQEEPIDWDVMKGLGLGLPSCEDAKPSITPPHTNTLKILAFLHVVEGIRVVVSLSPDVYAGAIIRVMAGEEIFPECYRVVNREDKDATLRLFTAHINFIEKSISPDEALRFRESIAEASRVPAEAWLIEKIGEPV